MLSLQLFKILNLIIILRPLNGIKLSKSIMVNSINQANILIIISVVVFAPLGLAAPLIGHGACMAHPPLSSCSYTKSPCQAFLFHWLIFATPESCRFALDASNNSAYDVWWHCFAWLLALKWWFGLVTPSLAWLNKSIGALIGPFYPAILPS
jgi:hypothetical protein